MVVKNKINLMRNKIKNKNKTQFSDSQRSITGHPNAFLKYYEEPSCAYSLKGKSSCFGRHEKFGYEPYKHSQDAITAHYHQNHLRYLLKIHHLQRI